MSVFGGDPGDEVARAGSEQPVTPAGAPPADWQDAVPPEITAVTRGHGRAIRVAGLGFVLLALALIGWWTQDLLGTVFNEGEARISEQVSFVATASTYRVVTSGPLKPAVETTVCDITLADERRLHILGGTHVNPVETLGTARVAQFDAVPGRTTVSCSDRRLPDNHHGRFQVVATNGPIRYALGTIAVLGGLGLAGGIASVLLRGRRLRPAA